MFLSPSNGTQFANLPLLSVINTGHMLRRVMMIGDVINSYILSLGFLGSICTSYWGSLQILLYLDVQLALIGMRPAQHDSGDDSVYCEVSWVWPPLSKNGK